MSFRQVERIVITNVSCNHVEHQGRPIDTMCLNTECQNVSSLCSRCLLKGHSQCRDKVCKLELIPGKLINLRQLQLDVVVLQENVNQQFKELISQIEQILSPLSKYQESPNLTNLNQIGSLLRQDPRTRIIQSINETKTQIKWLLENEKVNEQIEIHLVPQQSKQVSKAEYLEELKQSAKEWYDKGWALFRKGKYKEAIDCYDKAIELDPKHIDSWYQKGWTLYYQSKFKEAIDCYDKAIELDPKHIDSWYGKGWILYQQSKCKEAIDCYDKAIELDPKHIDSWYGKGRALSVESKYKEAIDCYDKAIELDPKHINSWYWKGWILYDQGKYKEAIDCYEKAIELDPKHIDSWFWKGMALGCQFKFKEAIDCYDKTIELDPKHFNSWYWKGWALGCQFKFKEAIQCCEDALKYLPNNSKIQIVLSEFKKQLQESQNNK